MLTLGITSSESLGLLTLTDGGSIATACSALSLLNYRIYLRVEYGTEVELREIADPTTVLVSPDPDGAYGLSWVVADDQGVAYSTTTYPTLLSPTLWSAVDWLAKEALRKQQLAFFTAKGPDYRAVERLLDRAHVELVNNNPLAYNAILQQCLTTTG